MNFVSSNEFVHGFGFARVRGKAFSAVRHLWSLRESQGWTQAKLAERMERDPAWVSRKLSGPTNWTLKTFGELANAMDGEVEITVCDLNVAPELSNHDAYSGYGANPAPPLSTEAYVKSDSSATGSKTVDLGKVLEKV